MTTLFGIKNCDTVKKARKWLESNDQTFTFHDFREDGLDKAQVQTWEKAVGKDLLINKRSTTWKQLSDDEKVLFSSSDKLSAAAVDIVVDNPTLIKRPVLAKQSQVLVGFKVADYEALF